MKLKKKTNGFSYSGVWERVKHVNSIVIYNTFDDKSYLIEK